MKIQLVRQLHQKCSWKPVIVALCHNTISIWAGGFDQNQARQKKFFPNVFENGYPQAFFNHDVYTISWRPQKWKSAFDNSTNLTDIFLAKRNPLVLVSNQRCHLVQIVPLVQSVVRLVLRWVQSVLGTINRVQHGKPIRVIAAASSQMVRDNVSKHLFCCIRTWIQRGCGIQSKGKYGKPVNQCERCNQSRLGGGGGGCNIWRDAKWCYCDAFKQIQKKHKNKYRMK